MRSCELEENNIIKLNGKIYEIQLIQDNCENGDNFILKNEDILNTVSFLEDQEIELIGGNQYYGQTLVVFHVIDWNTKNIISHNRIIRKDNIINTITEFLEKNNLNVLYYKNYTIVTDTVSIFLECENIDKKILKKLRPHFYSLNKKYNIEQKNKK